MCIRLLLMFVLSSSVMFQFTLASSAPLQSNKSQQHFAPRIIHGEKAQQGKWPMMVELVHKESSLLNHQCGATILNRNSILTAAHCLNTDIGAIPASDLMVYIGHVNVQYRDPDYLYQVDRYAKHPQWVDTGNDYDVAVVKLAHDITLNDGDHENIQSTCLPSAEDRFIADQCWTIGWGMDAPVAEKGQGTVDLMELPFPGLSAGEDELQQPYVVAGYSDGSGRDICFGDSGGPLLCPIEADPQRYYQFGVAALLGASDCGQAPASFTRLSLYLDFIRQQAEG